MGLPAIVQNLLNLFISMQIPLGTLAVAVSAAAAAIHMTHWSTFFHTIIALAFVFAAANLVSMYG